MKRFPAMQDWPLLEILALTATVEVASLEATAGELPIRLAEPARLGYMDDRVRIDRLEATAGETRLSASGELPLVDAPAGAPGCRSCVTVLSTSRGVPI